MVSPPNNVVSKVQTYVLTLGVQCAIKAISDRFIIIINEIKSCGKTYPNEEVVRKMLKSLPMSWDAKVTCIEEAKNLETLSLDELIGSLLTHEIRFK
ncbi:hypothetical protein J1N35_025602 [Gossypium stocksii]|uniref:UBN2 domain-containing protein n=1 Tax=Gossypium stocksii TaxID=47602 RepID=A0A9D3V6U7_9ROSI|nr:hypothetical protein J1N35_025602 [Gossypium stocksii]